MFVGHFGAALAAKRAAPRVSLGTLFLSFQFADLLWPILLGALALWFIVPWGYWIDRHRLARRKLSRQSALGGDSNRLPT